MPGDGAPVVIGAVEIPFEHWREVPPLLSFLRERGIDAHPAVPPACGIDVRPGRDDPAAIEVFVALHTWVEERRASLRVRVDGREFVLEQPPVGTPS